MATCSVKSCARNAKYKSPKPLCATHYHQWWRKNKDKPNGKKRVKAADKTCSVAHCKHIAKYRSPRLMCATHYHQWWRKKTAVHEHEHRQKRKPGRPKHKGANSQGIRTFIKRIFG